MNMKSNIRKEFLSIREKAKNSKNDKLILVQLLNDERFLNANLILTYVSTNDEVDTRGLISKSFELNKKIAVPKCEGNMMDFYFINSLEDLKPGLFNIHEPISTNRVINFENSVCITPGVVFDVRGYRIGYGAGYYDRFFENYNGYKIGLSYSDCVTNSLPNDEYDIPVDEIITEKGKVKMLEK